MTGRQFDNRRNRTLLGVAVVTISMVVAVALAGLGFAAQNSPTAAKSPAKSQYGGKVTICHHTHSLKNPVLTFTVSASAYPADKAQGDTTGPGTAKQTKHPQPVSHAKHVELQHA